MLKGETEAGVRLHADRGEVVKAHGEPSGVRAVGPPEAKFEVLVYDALQIEFALRKGKLVHITLDSKNSAVATHASTWQGDCAGIGKLIHA